MLKTTYTLREAAGLLSCHTETLRRAIMDGQLKAARLGRGWRISRLDLAAFWSARGGGELFSAGEELLPDRADGVEAGQDAEAVKKGAKQKKPAQTQLFLPTGPPADRGGAQ